MKKSKYFIISAVLMVCAFAGANHGVRSLGFIAPQIIGKGNVYAPQEGEIIYDSSDSTFYGRDGSGWVPLSTVSGAFVPPGTILSFAGTTAPTGYLLADGSAVSRTTYSNLFAVIGESFGEGDGSTTFNLPDLRGRFLRGVDGGTGRDVNAATRTAMQTGGNTGNNVGSIQNDSMQSHNHQWHNWTGAGTQSQFYDSNGNAQNMTQTGITANNHLLANNAGSAFDADAYTTSHFELGNSTETRPLNAYVHFVVKY